MTIFKGDTITVTNPTQLQYQVDGDGFGSGTVNPNGAAVTFTFNKIGNFAIFDEWHRDLTGFINVVDPALTPIIITVPSPITVQSTSSSGTAVTYSVTAVDSVDGPITPVCTPTSGSNFVVGATTVTCTARDSAGNSETATFTVTVQKQAPLDTASPIVTPPSNQVVTSTNSNGMVVNYPNATATDNVGVTSGPTCTPSSGSIFQVGTTTITCTASDAAGNVGRATFTVTVNVQPTPPQSLTPNITTAIAISSNQVSLSWTPPSQTYGQNINGYRIDQIVNGNFLQIDNVAGTVKTYEVPNLIPGNTYTFAVIALLSGGSTTNPSPSVSVALPSLSTSSVNQITIALGAGASANAACVSTNNCFAPNPLSVAVGTTVTWTNTDTVMHVICSGKPADAACGTVFEDDSLKPGKTFQFTFANAGTYAYYCSVHPWMTGQVVVGSGVQPIPTSSSSVITATTDKSSYSAGDSIVVSGIVSQINTVNPQQPVTIQTYDANNELVRIDQAIPTYAGTYSVTILTHGPMWQTAGTYSLKIQYDSPSVVSTLTFYFNPTSSQTSQQQLQITSGGALQVGFSTDPANPNTEGTTQLKINFINKQSGSNQQHIDYKVQVAQGSNQILATPTTHTAEGSISIPIQFQSGGTYTVTVEVNGVLFQPIPTQNAIFSLSVSGSQSTPPNYSGTNEIDIATGAGSSANAACVAANDCFYPNPLTVSPGTTVTWKNTDTAMHVVCSGKPSDDECGKVFEEDSLKPGKTFQFTFADVGTYDYYCSVHPWMTGQVIVGQGGKNSVSTFTPTGLSATVISPTQINLSWFAPTQNYGKIIVGYKIEQHTSYSVFDTVVYNTNSTITSYSMTGLKTGVPYTFRVSTVYSDDTSTDPSNSITVIPSVMSSTSASVFTPTPQDIQNIDQAKANQTIAAEVNVGVNQSTTTIDNNVSVQTTNNTPDSLNVNVSASNQTGPKVIAFNLPATTINVANLKDLGVMYDGKLIQTAPNMDAILHAKSTDNPSFAIIVTQSGVLVLVLIPHFSTHSITITNMSKIIPVVPEFPFSILALVIATFSIIFIPKILYRQNQ